jgi:glycosyltransferase involved in cell wall biosynthesis
MGRICITYRSEPERDRWLPGDRLVRPLVRRLVRGRPRPGGLDKVFINLRLGLDRLKIPYVTNLPYARLRADDLLGVLGRGRHCLDGYKQGAPFVAGIGLMTHPSEWPTLFEDYPVACYLQHSEWSAAIYRRFYGDRCAIWPVGIDTLEWQPTRSLHEKSIDYLVYEKGRWDLPGFERELLKPIYGLLDRMGLTRMTLRYGAYSPGEYREALAQSKAAIFLSSHESQGIACQEAMAAGVPILAWDPGSNMDPERFKWGEQNIPATSIPYFDARCGMSFADFASFESILPRFQDALRRGAFAPRDYMLENLTVEKCSQRFVDILREKLC